jgi:hypothetical protein
MKFAGYFVGALLIVLIAWAYLGINAALIVTGAIFIIGAFFVLQTKSLVHFYVETAPAISKLLKS